MRQTRSAGEAVRNPDPAIMPVAAKVCDRCLLGTKPLVSNDRRIEILTDLARSGRAFICHRASMRGDYIICRAFYEQERSLSVILARKLGLARFVDLP